MTKEQIRAAVIAYPTLALKSSPLRVEGNLPILHDDGGILDTYQISIKFYQGSFIKRFPHVYETGGRIPPVADRHVYSDGQLCLGTALAQERRLHARSMSLDDFFKEILYPFFASQSLIDLGELNVFPQGERSHGILGKVEEYMDFWQVSAVQDVAERLSAYVHKLKRNDPCFCQSGKKFKACHQREVNKIAFVDRELLKFDLKEIQEWLAKGRPKPKGLGRRFQRMFI
ncbi:SEC-C metal-binding domain-containing protein [Neolewinella agarilytica]|uniref:SEC-C motif-containing protein n=1 Tax=Neolewinella agarilytica TaxID=478744 RepID=A0A1H9HDF1_9BACT|nr:SEC-C metal-binding domain-containing protein [Neolewinella agarilytica]SEQ60322.1 SEC-C motif-containing protein [Neolewinella agarilytica]